MKLSSEHGVVPGGNFALLTKAFEARDHESWPYRVVSGVDSSVGDISTYVTIDVYNGKVAEINVDPGTSCDSFADTLRHAYGAPVVSAYSKDSRGEYSTGWCHQCGYEWTAPEALLVLAMYSGQFRTELGEIRIRRSKCLAEFIEPSWYEHYTNQSQSQQKDEVERRASDL